MENETTTTKDWKDAHIEVLNGYIKEYQILCDKKDEMIDGLLKTLNEKDKCKF